MTNDRRLGRMHSGVVRILSVLVGLAGLGYATLNVSPAGAASAERDLGVYGSPWLGIVTVVLFVVFPVAVSGFILVLSPEVIQRLSGGLAVAQLAVIAAWILPVAQGSVSPRISESWVLILCILPITLAAIAWRGAVVAVVGLVAFLLVSSLRVEAMSPAELNSGQVSSTTLNTMLIVLASCVVAVVVIVARRVATSLDIAAAAEASEVANSARDQVQLREKVRFDALMHDRILATLLLAQRDRVSARPQVALDARQALDQLGLLSTSGPGTPLARADMNAREFITQQREIALDAHPSVAFTFESEGDVELPFEMAQAMGEAAAEALRNSIRYAGVPFRTVERAVHVRVTSETVEVFILDNGAGFDQDAIPQARMGVAVSILDRMQSIERGEADIRSGVGVGTIVTLRWRCE